MAGEVETIGEKLKRLQESASLRVFTDDNCTHEIQTRDQSVFQQLVTDPAFAEYVLGLERGEGLPIVDDAQVGWTIDAAFADGSYRLRSPVGHVQRCQFVGSELTAYLQTQLTAAQSERDEARREVERLRAELFGPQKQPASVRQIEAQAKSAVNQLTDSVRAQSRALTSKPHGDKSQEGVKK